VASIRRNCSIAAIIGSRIIIVEALSSTSVRCLRVGSGVAIPGPAGASDDGVRVGWLLACRVVRGFGATAGVLGGAGGWLVGTGGSGSCR